MRWIDGLGRSQRVLVVIAFGLVLETVSSYLVNLGSGLESGWYAYAPVSNVAVFAPTGLHGWLRLIIWLVLIGVWALGSIRVLRPSADATHLSLTTAPAIKNSPPGPIRLDVGRIRVGCRGGSAKRRLPK